MHVLPLTRCGKDGHVLVRSIEVELQIAAALKLDPAVLRQRVRVTNRENPTFLKEETLVYLLREHHRAGDVALCHELAAVLLERCTPQASKYLWSLGQLEFESAHSDLISVVFEMILDLDSDRGDFLQVRFGLKLKQLAIDTFRRYDRIAEECAAQVPWSSVAGYAESEEDDVLLVSLPHEMRAPSQEQLRHIQAKEALQQIPEPQRTAFILFHHTGWPIRSKDPSTPTISKYFRKTPKTIYNWLKAAEQTLERWRGDQP
jgi:hypothetical protein